MSKKIKIRRRRVWGEAFGLRQSSAAFAPSGLDQRGWQAGRLTPCASKAAEGCRSPKASPGSVPVSPLEVPRVPTFMLPDFLGGPQ